MFAWFLSCIFYFFILCFREIKLYGPIDKSQSGLQRVNNC